ncbi:MAG: UDP-3-O-(3-hydroxymyristoyl)glucosamine N-acyltransferase, partial [Pseudomonadales bacterium]|nr:UDP-3-O-(3-hydroxymyristoyl)glucosamine N-acyltransferase [Pseudomonadales bacterium]
MVKKPRYRLGEIAEQLGGVLSGDPQLEITGLATLQRARADQLAFLSNPGYRKYLATSDAGAVILNAEAAKECPLPHIVVADPYLAYAKVSHWFDSAPVMAMGIDPSAKVSPQAHVATTACIGPFAVIESGAVLEAHAVVGSGCYVGQDCVIGAHSRLHPQVVLYHGVRLGRGVIIHSQAVIGADGFGFARSDNAWHKIAQIGSVIIGDDVEI